MLQAFVQVVLVALGLCKLHTILNRMVKAAQLRLGGFFVCKKLRIGLDILKLIHKKILFYTVCKTIIESIYLMLYFRFIYWYSIFFICDMIFHEVKMKN